LAVGTRESWHIPDVQPRIGVALDHGGIGLHRAKNSERSSGEPGAERNG
jgi:hypothetical protein